MCMPKEQPDKTKSAVSIHTTPDLNPPLVGVFTTNESLAKAAFMAAWRSSSSGPPYKATV